ncbi:hypothetical protein B566_EDAN009188 [Ephemera danica]|nr:hypothetical protein B566_EDAN009188 [Ephemera danica]
MLIMWCALLVLLISSSCLLASGAEVDSERIVFPDSPESSTPTKKRHGINHTPNIDSGDKYRPNFSYGTSHGASLSALHNQVHNPPLSLHKAALSPLANQEVSEVTDMVHRTLPPMDQTSMETVPRSHQVTLLDSRATASVQRMWGHKLPHSMEMEDRFLLEILEVILAMA